MTSSQNPRKIKESARFLLCEELFDKLIFVRFQLELCKVYPGKKVPSKFMINVMQMMIFATGMVCTCQDNILKMLERVATFSDMNQEYVNLLQPLFERYSCPSGATVIEQGQPADYLYVIIDGKAQVTYKPYDGTSITVAHVEKDGVFGWSAVVGSRTYTSSVTAIEDLDTYRIHGDELRKLCLDHPDAGKEILERIASVVSSRWSNSREQVKSILMNGMKC